MLELTNIYLFIITSFLLCLSPGPDNIYILSQSITKGKKAAIVTTLGLCTGIIIHTMAVTFGIAMIFKTSEIVFNFVKFIGVTYLLYIAFETFKHRAVPLTLSIETSNNELKKLYIKGFFMNLLNPKVSIFFLAFLPQFVTLENGKVPMQMITLGFIFMLLTIITFCLIAIIGDSLSSKLLKNTNLIKYMNILTSFVLGSLALKLAFSSR